MNKYNLKHVVDKELKLKVNEVKTKLTSVYEGVRFLGFVIRVANIKGFTRDFIQWLCRRLRMVKMKQ